MEQEENENNTLLHNINNINTNLLQKRNIWQHTIMPETCYAGAFSIQPDFKPNGYIMAVTGEIESGCDINNFGNSTVSEYSKKRRVGYNHCIKLSKGVVSFSYNAELYVDELKGYRFGFRLRFVSEPWQQGNVTLRTLRRYKG